MAPAKPDTEAKVSENVKLPGVVCLQNRSTRFSTNAVLAWNRYMCIEYIYI